MLDTLHLLFTYGLHGDLARFPRLYTALRQHEAQLGTDAPIVRLDLGAACHPDAWHCAATGGRSAYVVLDGMGYHAANVGGHLAHDERAALAGVTTMALLDVGRAWRLHVPPFRDEGIVVAATPTPALRLGIVCAPAVATTLEGNLLHLGAPPPWHIGYARVRLVPHAELSASAVWPLDPATPPDASIQAAVEFVAEEARSFQAKKGGA